MLSLISSLQISCTTERAALFAIYNNNGGINWIGAPSWKTMTGICTWEGVTCRRGIVVDLDLSNFGLIGPLDPNI